MTPEPEPDPTDARPRPTWRGAVFAAVYGALVATIAYVVGRDNLLVAVLLMVLIGVLFRLYAYVRIRRHGAQRPPWWKWL